LQKKNKPFFIGITDRQWFAKNQNSQTTGYRVYLKENSKFATTQRINVMVDLKAAKAKIIERLQTTDEEWVIRSIQKLLDIEEDADTQFWNEISMDTLQPAYDINEPDYEDYMIKEPNPDYKK